MKKVCMLDGGEGYTELFYEIIPTSVFCHSVIPTPCYSFILLFMLHFVVPRCWLKNQQTAISSLTCPAMETVPTWCGRPEKVLSYCHSLQDRSQAIHTAFGLDQFSQFRNWLPRLFLRIKFENGIANEAIVPEWMVSSVLWDFEVVKKRWGCAMRSVKCCCFVQKLSW